MRVLSLLIGWLLDKCLGDPQWVPHPIVLFGKMIAWGDRKLNRGNNRVIKGATLAIMLVLLVFVLTGIIHLALLRFSLWSALFFDSVCFFSVYREPRLSGKSGRFLSLLIVR